MLSLGEVGRACVEYADSAVELIRSGRDLRRLGDLLKNIRQACQRAKGPSELKVLRELVEVYLASGVVSVRLKDQKSQELREFAALLRGNGLRDVAIRQLGQTQDLWRRGPLPHALILDAKGDIDAQLSLLHVLLRKGYGAAIAESFIEVVGNLIRAQRRSDAEELLSRYLPLDSARSYPEVVLWAKFLEQKGGGSYERFRALLKAALKAEDREKGGGLARQEAIQRLLQLALREKDYSAIADRQQYFSKALLLDQDGLDTYLSALIFLPEMEEPLDLAARDSIIAYAASARALAAGKSNTSNRKQITATKGMLAKTSIHRDILELERLTKSLEAVGRLGNATPISAGPILLPLIQAADNSIDNAKRHRWASRPAYDAAKVATRAYATNMAKVLESLPQGAKVGSRNPREIAARVRLKVME